MAEDARALLDHLGIARADVMGYSMGARITAFLALAHPERVRSVVLGGLGIHLVDGVGLPREHRRRDGGAVARRRDGPAGRMFRAFADQTKIDLRALAACIRGSRQTLTREQVAAIAVPVLVASARKDPIAGSARRAGRADPGRAGASTIPGRDHMLAVGDKVFKAGVLQFLEETAVTVRSAPRRRRSPARPATRWSATWTARRAPPVLLLHGGGQTRHAWRKTGARSPAWLGRLHDRPARPRRQRMGRRTAPTTSAISPPTRCWRDTLAAPKPACPPVAVGASLGGIASLLANGGGTARRFPALVLVDITPRIDPDGVAKVQGFMRAHAGRASARSRRPPRRSRPICRIGRARARTRA